MNDRTGSRGRVALARHHTVLHVLNTMLRDYAAWITGVQINVDYSRIDFKWEGFSPVVCGRNGEQSEFRPTGEPLDQVLLHSGR